MIATTYLATAAILVDVAARVGTDAFTVIIAYVKVRATVFTDASIVGRASLIHIITITINAAFVGTVTFVALLTANVWLRTLTRDLGLTSQVVRAYLVFFAIKVATAS
jgi:hypothetical protein